MNSVSIRENIKNAFEIVRKTYESVDKLLAEMDRQSVECGFVPVTPQFLRWKSDREYRGWFIQSFIKLYQRDSAPPCQSGNGLKNDPIYAVEISFEEEPRMTLCKYVYSTLEHWDKPPSVSEHWFFYWPLYDGNNFTNHESENGVFKRVPNDEKTSEKYGKIQEVISKEIDLLPITSTNIKDRVFDELKRL
ncbi:hypothetical protein L3V64_006910 [Geobacillus stearothermophilus]|uniref:hypothetical protein n=1 Tax=Geobacillus stearothermophilus TaxID=1422 RepID=UPI001F3108BA|nr:hypothetical protein [Geobacillus stearothermophilus]MCK7606085.1 hypothetical protein [Geobacillus stearothermophilus]